MRPSYHITQPDIVLRTCKGANDGYLLSTKRGRNQYAAVMSVIEARAATWSSSAAAAVMTEMLG